MISFTVCSFQGTRALFFRTLSLWLIGSVINNKNDFLLLIADPALFFFIIGGHLLSHTVSSIVPSAVWVLTIVFGMGTGVTPRRIATKNFCYLYLLDNQTVKQPLLFFLERRWSSRTFRYGYLVTTSPQLSILPSAAPSLRLGHWLRALPTPMVWRAVCTRPGNVFTAAFWSAITSDSSFM